MRGTREGREELREKINPYIAFRSAIHPSTVCWPALCLATAVEMNADTQEVEYLALPHTWMCARSLQSFQSEYMKNGEKDVIIQHTHKHTSSIGLF